MTKSHGQSDTAPESARGAATRRRLVEATVALVAEQGWDGVTTRQIADRAGANQALINYHFGSKERLLRVAVETTLREGFSTPVEAMLAAPRLADGAIGLVRALAAMSHADPVVRFSMEAMARAARDRQVQQVMADLLAGLRAELARGVAAAQRRGELSASLDPEGTAAVLGAIFDGLGLHLLIDPTLDVGRMEASIRSLLPPDPEGS